MVRRGKIACFFSGGYSEASGHMQHFLYKINDSLDYYQCMPNSTRRRKGSPRTIKTEYNGLSGPTLLKEVYKYLSKSYIIREFENGNFLGILIEDDLDGRFDCLEKEEIVASQNKIKERIANILGKEYPVFFIYAAPEVESWFVADWNNGFGGLFARSNYFHNTSADIRKLFSIELRKRIIKMMPDESVDEIEKYAFDSDGKYRKLSNDIQIQIEQTIQSMLKDKEIEGLIRLYYSKALHAGYMLSEIEPEIVRKYCRNYFCDNYMELVNYY